MQLTRNTLLLNAHRSAGQTQWVNFQNMLGHFDPFCITIYDDNTWFSVWCNRNIGQSCGWLVRHTRQPECWRQVTPCTRRCLQQRVAHCADASAPAACWWICARSIHAELALDVLWAPDRSAGSTTLCRCLLGSCLTLEAVWKSSWSCLDLVRSRCLVPAHSQCFSFSTFHKIVQECFDRKASSLYHGNTQFPGRVH